MITLEDCIEFCGLTKEEVLAIAEHEHVPEIGQQLSPATFYAKITESIKSAR